MISQITAAIRLLGILGAVVAATSGCSWDAPRPEVDSSSPVAHPSHRSEDSAGERAASIALRQLGLPYSYGGNSPRGFDCSGLIQYSYAQAGMSLPRTTSEMWRQATPVGRSDMQVGDVLFFDISGKVSHVGLYLGDDRFVHAPSTGRTVSVESLQSAYYRKAFLRAGRF